MVRQPTEKEMTMKIRRGLSALLALVVGAVMTIAAYAGDEHSHRGKTDIPRYVVDPYWPKPLPNRWVTGAVGGICVDQHDHIFGINRSDITALEARVGKVAAPPVIEYDQEGNM